MPVPALPNQWLYPDFIGAGWDSAHSECQYSPSPPFRSTDIGSPADQDPTPSASSSSTTVGSPSSFWHSVTPPVSNMTYAGIDNATYINGLSGMEQFTTTETEPNTGSMWSDFEPHVAPHQSGSTQIQSVRTFLQVTIFRNMFADLAHGDGENRNPKVGRTGRSSRQLRSDHLARHKPGTIEFPSWLPTSACQAEPPVQRSSRSLFK
jgi:hypothetical protein